MKKYFTLDKNGFIASTADLQFPQEGQEIFNFPNDFDFLNQGNYKIVDGKLIDATEKQANLAAIAEKSRPLTEAEVSAMFITQQINTLVVDDNTALRMKSFYPTFESIVGQTVKNGFKFTHNGKLWRTVQPEMTIQSHYPPRVGMESLYTEVCETHDGTLDDPIPYDGNMALENGKYYIQNYTIYLCNRDTVNPVYNALSELVGLYVEEV